MEFVYNDGGRSEAGFKGTTGDCVCRAIAIATQRPYKEIYDLINEFGKKKSRTKRQEKGMPTTVTDQVQEPVYIKKQSTK